MGEKRKKGIYLPFKGPLYLLTRCMGGKGGSSRKTRDEPSRAVKGVKGWWMTMRNS